MHHDTIAISRYCYSQWSNATMHHNTITNVEAPITIFLLSIVINHNASRYNNCWRSPYHETVTLNDLTSKCITIQKLMEKPLSRYCYFQWSYIIMHHNTITIIGAPITTLLLSMSSNHNASRSSIYWRSPCQDTVTLNGNTP